MAANHRTSTSNGMTAKPSSSSILCAWSAATDSAARRLTSYGCWSRSTRHSCWRGGMSSSAVDTQASLAVGVEVSDDTLSVELADGLTIAAPLGWYPRLAHATVE